MNRSDFADWKRHPVTKEVFSQLRSRVRDIQEALGNTAGIDSHQDRRYVGAIEAYNDLLNIEYEGEKE